MSRRPVLYDAQGRKIPTKKADPLARAFGQRAARVRDTASVLAQKVEPADGVCGFECVALDSVHVGQRMLLVYGPADFAALQVGQRAPDTQSFGAGWKFRLVKKFNASELDAASRWLHRADEELR